MLSGVARTFLIIASLAALAIGGAAEPALAQSNASPPTPEEWATRATAPPASVRIPKNALEALDMDDFLRAERFAIVECGVGNAFSCKIAGEIFQKGLNGKTDLDRAVYFFRIGCDLGLISSCNILAIAHHQRDPKAEITAEMTQLLIDTCELDYAMGCSNAGWRFEQGLGVDRDSSRARQLYVKACDLGFDTGCLNAAVAFERPIGGEQDYAKALDYHARACALEELQGCYWVAAYQQIGRTVPQDVDAAYSQYVELCAKDHGQSCASVSASLSKGRGAKKDTKSARVFARKACDLDFALGCNQLGLLHENGEGGKKSRGLAMSTYREGCDKKDGASCMNLSRLVGMENADLAIELLERACEYKRPEACEILKIE